MKITIGANMEITTNPSWVKDVWELHCEEKSIRSIAKRYGESQATIRHIIARLEHVEAYCQARQEARERTDKEIEDRLATRGNNL